MPHLASLFRYLCLFLALPVLWLLGGPLLENAWNDLRSGALSTDLLLLLGVVASYAYSALVVLRDSGRVYFEVGCMVLVLVTLGRWLEASARLHTSEALRKLRTLLPERVRLRRPDGFTEIPLSAVEVGDVLRVLPGERIPCDGILLDHPAVVDEQFLTGESVLKELEPGARLLGGSLSVDSELLLGATTRAGDGALARLVKLVEEAQQNKGRLQRLADRVSAWFLPAVVFVGLATFGWHATRNLNEGILAGLAVVLIACPCALGLAVPLAVWKALGEAAGRHVLFRNGEAIELLATARAICFDKTGTLTTEAPSVSGFVVGDDEERQVVLSRAAKLASGSTHPHSQAISRFTESQDVPSSATATPSPIHMLAGRGLVGVSASGEEIVLGSLRLMNEKNLALGESLSRLVQEIQEQGSAFSCIGWQGRVRGVFVFREQVRPGAAEAVKALRDRGLAVRVLTGDHAVRAAVLAGELGVEVEGELLPEEKVEALTRMRRQHGPVVMVGDGVNDAPALVASDVGVAVGCGADVSRDAAIVCLIDNDLAQLPWAIELARGTVRTMKRNLFWAFAYNVVGVGLACTGMLNPILAAAAMLLSSAFVVASSSRPFSSLAEIPALSDAGSRTSVVPDSQPEEVLR
jgi:heavy metal translocating P-type ATPase